MYGEKKSRPWIRHVPPEWKDVAARLYMTNTDRAFQVDLRQFRRLTFDIEVLAIRNFLSHRTPKSFSELPNSEILHSIGYIFNTDEIQNHCLPQLFLSFLGKPKFNHLPPKNTVCRWMSVVQPAFGSLNPLSIYVA